MDRHFVREVVDSCRREIALRNTTTISFDAYLATLVSQSGTMLSLVRYARDYLSSLSCLWLHRLRLFGSKSHRRRVSESREAFELVFLL